MFKPLHEEPFPSKNVITMKHPYLNMDSDQTEQDD